MTTTDDKELLLKNDIRLLGRLLGDTLRNQAGDAVFDLVERIRKLAIRYHRDDDSTARIELAALMTSVPREHTSHVVRAFSYFSHLTTIAEGVEREAQLNLLMESGCHLVQGFLVAKPLPLTSLAKWMRDWAQTHSASGTRAGHDPRRNGSEPSPA